MTPLQRGHCYDCGDSWEGFGDPVICPECHSTAVVAPDAEDFAGMHGTLTFDPNNEDYSPEADW
jgi:hypothetical protein